MIGSIKWVIFDFCFFACASHLSHLSTFSMLVRVYWKWALRFLHTIHEHAYLTRKEVASVTKLDDV